MSGTLHEQKTRTPRVTERRYTATEERGRFEEYQDRASTLIRQLALAGIAVVWIFVDKTPPAITLPSEFLLPLLFMLLAVAFDLLSYVAAAAHSLVSFLLLQNRGWKKAVARASRVLDTIHPQVLFFVFAVGMILIAYLLLLYTLLRKINFR